MKDDRVIEDLVRSLLKEHTDHQLEPARPRPRSEAGFVPHAGSTPQATAGSRNTGTGFEAALLAKTSAWLGKAPALPTPTRTWKPKGDKAFYLSRSPARLNIGRAGTRFRTDTSLRFQADHAAARDAVVSPVDPQVISSLGLIEVTSAATDKREFLLRPDLGRRLSETSRTVVTQKGTRSPQIQMVVADGLSATAVSVNVPLVLPQLQAEFARLGFRTGQPFYVSNGRVGSADEVGRLLKAQLLVLLIGERPGLKSAESMGCYVTWLDVREFNESKRSMVSNIHRNGLTPEDAVRHITALCKKAMEQKRTGVELVP